VTFSGEKPLFEELVGAFSKYVLDVGQFFSSSTFGMTVPLLQENFRASRVIFDKLTSRFSLFATLFPKRNRKNVLRVSI